MFERIKRFFGRTGSMNKQNNILLQDERVSRSYYADGKLYHKINEWIDMYENSAENDETLGLPAAICRELAQLVTLEMEFEVSDAKVDNNAKEKKDNKNKKETRAEFINKQIQPVVNNAKKYTEYACAGGGLVFKPIMNAEKGVIDVEVVYANRFVPLIFNNEGVMTSVMFLDEKKVENKYFHRFECHELVDTVYKVTNKAYVSFMEDSLGKPCSLTEVDEWADLSEETTLNNVPFPLFVYWKIPDGNCLDMNSPLGVSAFYRSVPHIRQADRQWSRYLYEFESGERMIAASKDMFENDSQGNPIVPEGRERLFWKTEIDGSDTSKLIDWYSPDFREIALKAGLNTILQRVEFNAGLAYGTLSDPQQIEKTAQEIRTSKQRSYSTVSSIQESLDTALNDLVKVIDTYCDLYINWYKEQKYDKYNIPDKSEFNIKSYWDDSIIVDADTDRARDLNEVRQGIMQKYEFRMKWYGEDEETAKRKVAEQEQKTADAFANSNFGNANNKGKQE